MLSLSWIEERHLIPDHVHMMIAIPPKYAASEVVGYIKSKSAIHLARIYAERRRKFVDQVLADFAFPPAPLDIKSAPLDHP